MKSKDPVIKRSSDLKLRKSAELRIAMKNERITPLVEEWIEASPEDKKSIESQLAIIGEEIINIYTVNSRSQ